MVTVTKGVHRPGTSRQIAKAATRAKVLETARIAFETLGYEAATIRDIANMAGLSTGAIFASFADKAALYRAIYDHPPISPELGRQMLVALEGAEHLYQHGILATPNEEIDRVHTMRRQVIAQAKAA